MKLPKKQAAVVRAALDGGHPGFWTKKPANGFSTT